MASGVIARSCARNSSLTLIFSGCVTGIPSCCASRFTAGATTSMPRPLGRSGCATTSFTVKCSASASRVGTANSGVPQKTKFIVPSFALRVSRPEPSHSEHQTRNAVASLPLSRLLQFLHFAQDQIAFQPAEVANIEPAVQVIDFVLEGSRQQPFTLGFKPIAVYVLSADLYLTRTSYVLAKFRDAEAAFGFALLPFLVDDLRVCDHQLLCRILFKADIDNGQPRRNPDLRRRQANTMRRVHGFEHIFD